MSMVLQTMCLAMEQSLTKPPSDLKTPAVKLVRRIQSIMKDGVMLNLIVRQFESNWYVSVDNGKWENLGK